MKKNNPIKIKYDVEADVLSWELSRKAKIDHATEMENVVVHFSKENTPVLVEVLLASKLFKKSEEKIKEANKCLVFSR